MSRIKTYREGRFSQINLDDGKKILISRGEDTRVFQLVFFGLFNKILHIFSDLYIANLISKRGIRKDNIKYLANELSKSKSLDEAKAKCLQLEADMAKGEGYEIDVSDGGE